MGKNIDACFSHNSDDWRTPSWLYHHMVDLGYIDVFPYQCEYDELSRSYVGKKLFINPPFSKLPRIIYWLISCVRLNRVVLLIPTRSDTKYWHLLLKENPKIYFIEGRLHFNDSLFGAPFPCVLMVFDRYCVPTYKSISQEDLKLLRL